MIWNEIDFYIMKILMKKMSWILLEKKNKSQLYLKKIDIQDLLWFRKISPTSQIRLLWKKISIKIWFDMFYQKPNFKTLWTPTLLNSKKTLNHWGFFPTLKPIFSHPFIINLIIKFTKSKNYSIISWLLLYLFDQYCTEN